MSPPFSLQIAAVTLAALLNVAAHGAPLQVEGLVLPFREVKLGSPVDAVVREIKVKEGDWVKQGQVLALLYSPVEMLEAKRSEKVLQKAEFDWRGNERLLKDKIVSGDKALASKLEYEVALIESQRALALVDEKTLKAPWDGQIIRQFKEEGETVTRIQEVFQLINYSKVFAQLFLEAAYLPKITEGQAVKVRVPLLSGHEYDATVHFVDPVVDAGSGLFRVKVLLPNPEHLIKPGVTAIVTVPGVEARLPPQG